jgi:hypothetical protein
MRDLSYSLGQSTQFSITNGSDTNLSHPKVGEVQPIGDRHNTLYNIRECKEMQWKMIYKMCHDVAQSQAETYVLWSQSTIRVIITKHKRS